MNTQKCWRRGWDSNPGASLNLRKLLNLRSATFPATARIARVGYSLGTLALLAGLFAGAASPQEQPRTFRIPFHTVNSLILLEGQLNGKPAVFLLETGAGPNFATYEAAGLKPHEGIIENRHVEITFGELRVTCPARIVLRRRAA